LSPRTGSHTFSSQFSATPHPKKTVPSSLSISSTSAESPTTKKNHNIPNTEKGKKLASYVAPLSPVWRRIATTKQSEQNSPLSLKIQKKTSLIASSLPASPKISQKILPYIALDDPNVPNKIKISIVPKWEVVQSAEPNTNTQNKDQKNDHEGKDEPLDIIEKFYDLGDVIGEGN
jgi:hypothetical protein